MVSAQPAPPSSIVEIPIRIPLERLFELAEQEIPLQTGHWRDWKKYRGVRTKLRVWRGPLSFTLQGNVLSIQAHVRYWIKAQKSLLGRLDLNSSCGVNEPPRQALIGVQIRLGWKPDWTLQSAFSVMPTRYLDRCAMTIANIDMTPVIDNELQKQLKDKMQAALTTLVPRLTDIRHQAEQNWIRLQQPLSLWADHWLVLEPQGVALSSLTGNGDRLDAVLALSMEPKVLTGPIPELPLQPLPPLMRIYPRSDGLNVQLAVELDYAALSQNATERLSDELLDIAGRRVGITAVSLGAQGQDLRVNVTLSGQATGYVTLMANLMFEPEAQQIQINNLTYIYQPEDPWLETQAHLFRGYIQKSLEIAANQQLQQRTNQWKERLHAIFDEIIPDVVTLDTNSLRLREVQFEFTENVIKLNGLLSGHVLLNPH